tara:strand:- start:5402 stop:5734 length:333 start_codon:yes stop_codon:yes gene_type:complete
MKSYKHFLDYCAELAQDIIDQGEGDDPHDAIHECADNSQHVIYHGRAWDLVDLVRRCHGELLNDAEARAEEAGLPLDEFSLNSLMSCLAFHILALGIEKALSEKLAGVSA